MRKFGIFIIVGALAGNLQACTSNNDRNDNMDMDSRDSIYNDSNNNNPNITSPMADDSLVVDPLDTIGTN